MKKKCDIKKSAGAVVKRCRQGKFLIPKIEAQIKGILIDLDNLKNRSMRSTWIFKNMREEN